MKKRPPKQLGVVGVDRMNDDAFIVYFSDNSFVEMSAVDMAARFPDRAMQLVEDADRGNPPIGSFSK
jgi:hypothetical protein